MLRPWSVMTLKSWPVQREGYSGERKARRSALVRLKNFLMDHEIHALLKKMTGRTVIFICDSCFSGTVYKTFDPFFVQIKTLDVSDEDESVFDQRSRSRSS